jgi:hypothetical protein
MSREDEWLDAIDLTRKQEGEIAALKAEIAARDDAVVQLREELKSAKRAVVEWEQDADGEARLRRKSETERDDLLSANKLLHGTIDSYEKDHAALRAALEAITKLDEKTYKDCYAAPTIARRALGEGK